MNTHTKETIAGRRSTITLAALIAAGATSSASACPVLEHWSAFTDVTTISSIDFSVGTTEDRRSGYGGDPLSFSLHAARGGGINDAQVAIDSAGLRSSWEHVLTPGDLYLRTRTAHVHEFRMDHDSTYSLNGLYSASGHTRMSAIIELKDAVTGATLFRHNIDSISTDPTLVLGVDGSFAWHEEITGSQTGSLAAGTRYRLAVDVFLADGPNADGFGWINLEIAPCPTPGAITLLGFGALCAGRRRR